MNAWVERVHRAGIQVNCHANGDVAIDMYLTAMERALKLLPRANARPKITHCTMLNPSLIARMKAMGAVPALFTTYAYYNPDKFVYYGEEFMKNAMAFRSLIDAGIYACAGSDFSPGPFAPLMGIQGMVTRKGWDGKVWGANQRISVERSDRRQHLQRRVGVRRRSDQGIDHRRQARGLRRARRRSAHGRCREDQGHPDRAHRRRRDDLTPGVAIAASRVAATPWRSPSRAPLSSSKDSALQRSPRG